MALLPGWPWYKIISLTGQTGAGTLYQVDLDIGASAGGDFHLEGHCTNFPQDIEVTDDDGTTLLDFWIDDITADPIKLWVEVADDLGSNRDVRVYYGKSGATTNSDGDTTFLKYDQFDDLNDWSTASGKTTAVLDSTHILQGTYAAKSRRGAGLMDVMTRSDIVDNAVYSMWAYDSSHYWFMTNLLTDSTYNLLGHPPTGSTTVYSYRRGSNVYSTSVSQSIGWHEHKYILDGTNIKYYIDDVNVYNVAYTNIDTFEFGCYWESDAGDTWFDQFTVRKYNDPEPAFSSAGSEESAPTAIPMFKINHGLVNHGLVRGGLIS